MRVLAIAAFAAVAWAAAAFWEAKPPSGWSDEELHEFLTNSPWAQQAISGKQSSGVQVYLASSHLMREAEAEADRRAEEKRKTAPVEDPTAGEYADFLRENDGKYIIIAVSMRVPKALDDPAEVKRMEQECTLEAGGRKYKITGHFPPSLSDPWLRLVFPRVVTDGVEKFRLRLYIPSAAEPYRFAEFRVKELVHHGTPDF